MKTILVLLAALLVWNPESRAQVLTLAGPPTTSVPQAASLETVDFDGDGYLDIVVSSGTTGEVAVHRNLSALSPGLLGAGYGLSGGQYWTIVATGDLAGDSRPDIVGVNGLDATCVSSTLRVWTNTSLGTAFQFSPPISVSLGFRATAVAIGDVLPSFGREILLLDRCGRAVQVYGRNSSGAAWTSLATIPLGDDIQHNFADYPRLIVKDVDANGALDFVACAYGTVYVGYNLSAQWYVHPIPMSYYAGIDVGDVDQDGLLDIVTSSQTSQPVRVARQIAVGNFLVATTPSVPWAESLALGDFDGDGFRDIYVASNPSQNYADVHLLKNTGGGQAFAGPVKATATIETYFGHAKILSLDADGDGSDDIVRVGSTLGQPLPTSIEVWMNTSPQATPPYPGTGSDLVLTSVVQGGTGTASGPYAPLKLAAPGAFVNFAMQSPGGQLVGSVCLMTAQLVPPGGSLNPSFPGSGLHVDVLQPLYFLINGLDVSPIPGVGFGILPPSGIGVGLQTPSVSLIGWKMRVQGAALQGAAMHATDAHEISFL